jgi:hypothetical protein
VYEVKIKDGEIRLILHADGKQGDELTPLQAWRKKKPLVF